ncbi:thioesterase family protein [uncultured Corynebacterium sp.]|uniref:thioesterase family protein n=1 Tax=uncultured Corynebacterium sp. TaxID=159447 RepID=UPI0025F56516|nr:thioesterase family protein [uncultured Corynebacterium sp.]
MDNGSGNGSGMNSDKSKALGDPTKQERIADMGLDPTTEIDAYFEHLGQADPEEMGLPAGEVIERYRPTLHTWGPWGAFQHGAPPAAILTHALQHCPGLPDGMRTTRVAVDILGAVPYTEVRTRCRISRPGRQILKVEAELFAEGRDGTWRAVASASAWRMAVIETGEVEQSFARPIPGPEEAGDGGPLYEDWDCGYIDSIDIISLPDPDEPQGRHRIHWVRTDKPIVDGVTTDGVEYLMSMADVANGVGASLDPRKWMFMNTDLVVHLHREPEGEWIGISAKASIGPDGIGMTAASLYDQRGPVGRSMQTLLVRPQAK